MGKDMDCPPNFSLATADNMAASLDALQVSFYMPQQTLVHLRPAVRREQDPSLSESNSWDIPQGEPLHAVLPTLALRQCIQMLHHLDAELDIAADFYLSSPVASS